MDQTLAIGLIVVLAVLAILLLATTFRAPRVRDIPIDWDAIPEFAHYPPHEGAHRIVLHGGPLDGWEVGLLRKPPRIVKVHGPRDGDHRTWTDHIYERRESGYAFVRSDMTSVSASAGPPGGPRNS